MELAHDRAQQGNLRASLAYLNLLIHRGKRADLLPTYERLAKSCEDYDPGLAEEARDNAWRMVNHHPAIFSKNREALSLWVQDMLKEIEEKNSQYKSVERAISYAFGADFTKDQDKKSCLKKAREEFECFLHKNLQTIDGTSFWMFYEKSLHFMIVACDIALGECTNGQDHVYLRNYIEKEPEFSEHIKDSVKFLSSLMENNLNKDIKDRLEKDRNVNKYFYGLGQVEQMVADLLALSHPDCSLELYKMASALGNESASYAVGDFQKDPTERFLHSTGNAVFEDSWSWQTQNFWYGGLTPKAKTTLAELLKEQKDTSKRYQSLLFSQDM